MSVDPKASYYDHGGIETVEILRAKLTAEEFRGWVKGELLTHVCRMPWKGDEVRDAEKAATYAAWLRDELQAPPAERQRQIHERYDFTAPPALDPGDVTQALDAMAAEQDAGRPADGRPSIHNCRDGASCKHKCGTGPCRATSMLLREQAG